MAYRRKTLQTGKTPKRLDRAPAHPSACHMVRGVPGIAGKATAHGMSRTESEKLIGPAGVTFVAITVMLSTLGTLNGSILTNPRVFFAMAADGLLSVNGVRTRTVTDYVEAKNLRLDGMEIVVFRAGEERTEELRYAAQAEPLDPAALLAELVTLRLAGDALEEDKDPSRSS